MVSAGKWWRLPFPDELKQRGALDTGFEIWVEAEVRGPHLPEVTHSLVTHGGRSEGKKGGGCGGASEWVIGLKETQHHIT